MMELQKQIESLMAQKGYHWLNISNHTCENTIVVAQDDTDGKTELYIVVDYPFSEPSLETFKKIGLSIVSMWKERDFKIKSHVEYIATGTDAKIVAGVIADIFTKLLQVEPDQFSLMPETKQ